VHLKTTNAEGISLDEYKDQIENPLRKFLDANNGAMRRKILYIVPIYGIPLKVPDKFSPSIRSSVSCTPGMRAISRRCAIHITRQPAAARRVLPNGATA